MIKNKLIILAGAVIALSLGFLASSNNVYASNVTFTADTTVTFSNSSVNLIVLSGSKADSLINNGTNLQVIIANGDTFTASSSNGTRISVSGNTSATLDYKCNNVAITGG